MEHDKNNPKKNWGPVLWEQAKEWGEIQSLEKETEETHDINIQVIKSIPQVK